MEKERMMMKPVPRMPLAPPWHVEIEFEWSGRAVTTTVHRQCDHAPPGGSPPAWLNLWSADQCRDPDGARVGLSVEVGAGESVVRVSYPGMRDERVPQAVALTSVRPLRSR